MTRLLWTGWRRQSDPTAFELRISPNGTVETLISVRQMESRLDPSSFSEDKASALYIHPDGFERLADATFLVQGVKERSPYPCTARCALLAA